MVHDPTCTAWSGTREAVVGIRRAYFKLAHAELLTEGEWVWCLDSLKVGLGWVRAPRRQLPPAEMGKGKEPVLIYEVLFACWFVCSLCV